MATLIVSEKTTLVYVDKYGFNKLPKDQRFIETKNTQDIYDDNFAESESVDNANNVDDSESMSDPESEDSSNSEDVNGIVDESLMNNGGEVSDNFHPVDQGAMTSLGRSVRMLLSPLTNGQVDSDDSDSDSVQSEYVPLKNSVEQVTAEIEQEQGTKVSENTKRTVLEQLKQKFGNMSLRGSGLPEENELLQVCRDMYHSVTFTVNLSHQ